jgi:hypothetical protein
MYKPWRTVVVLVAFIAAVFTVTSLHADSMHGKSGAIIDGGGMMSHIGRMHGMMEGCTRMMGMQGGHSEKPNDQWRKKTPDKKS